LLGSAISRQLYKLSLLQIVLSLLPSTRRVSSWAISKALPVADRWRLAAGGWRLIAGGWWLVAGG